MPSLTAAVVTHRMDREFRRTAWTLEHQQGASVDFWRHESRDLSPCKAMNTAVRACDSDIVLCLIDGARMLTPGICRKVLQAFKVWEDPFVYTIGLHLGPERQNILAEQGWTREKEDALLDSVDWRGDGYELFRIASYCGGSQEEGFWCGVSESNCFAVRRETYWRLGGYDERFKSPGGGIANLELFRRFQAELEPVQLLGEATMHQFHHGVASNAKRKDHPLKAYHKEYKRIFGEPFQSHWRRPSYLGDVAPQAEWVFCE